jgi:hypothetical protein
VDNDLTNSSFFRASDIEQALAEIKEEESLAQKDTPTQPSQASIKKRLVLFSLIGVSLINTFVLGVVDVIAVSGFIGHTGIESLPWLWVGELSLSLLISTVVLQIIDKFPRLKIMKKFLIILFATYVLLALFFILQISNKVLYPIMCSPSKVIGQI